MFPSPALPAWLLLRHRQHQQLPHDPCQPHARR